MCKWRWSRTLSLGQGSPHPLTWGSGAVRPKIQINLSDLAARVRGHLSKGCGVGARGRHGPEPLPGPCVGCGSLRSGQRELARRQGQAWVGLSGQQGVRVWTKAGCCRCGSGEMGREWFTGQRGWLLFPRLSQQLQLPEWLKMTEMNSHSAETRI